MQRFAELACSGMKLDNIAAQEGGIYWSCQRWEGDKGEEDLLMSAQCAKFGEGDLQPAYQALAAFSSPQLRGELVKFRICAFIPQKLKSCFPRDAACKHRKGKILRSLVAH